VGATKWTPLPYRGAALAIATVAALTSPAARGDDAARAAAESAAARPPAPKRAFIQYGVAFTVEGVAAPGPICSDASNPCILGSGGGIAVRVGWRPTESLYLGGAYELSKQDPNELYRLAILQQARAEARHYFPSGRSATPFALLAGGVAGYGNEWAIDTWGPSGTIGAGLEVELSGLAVLGVTVAYRPVYFKQYVDSSTIHHDAGFAHFMGLELALEAKDAL
jgi:hypothetical protein